MWQPQFELARHGWRLIAPDLRGFGEGAADPEASSVDDYAADVIDLLDALHVGEAVITGLSMGAYVTFALLRHAPAYAQALVLADTRAQADTPEGVAARKQMLATLADRGAPAVVESMLPRLLGESTRAGRPDLVEEVRALGLSNSPAAIAGAIRALMTRPDSTPLLATIRCPTLIVVGAEDAITPPALSEDMHRSIAGSQLVVVPGAGHLANLEQPAAFNDALAAFLTHRV
jgi:3-oxoadipate enol-lactonase